MKKRLSLLFGIAAAILTVLTTQEGIAEAKEPLKAVVYTNGEFDGVGNGTKEKPYKYFDGALKNVSAGGTIYIQGKEAFINMEDESAAQPFIIDKEVTVTAGDPTETIPSLKVRAAGIFMMADVTFSDVGLAFTNKRTDAIFANGHTLVLDNVWKADGCRTIDLVAGGLYGAGDSETEGKIIIKSDRPASEGYSNEFGNIFGGSMDSSYKGSAVIEIYRNHNSFKYGGVYGCGAQQAEPGNDFDVNYEPEAQPDAEKYPVSGNVDIKLAEPQNTTYSGTGVQGAVSVEIATTYLATPVLEDVDNLTVKRGSVELKSLSEITGNLVLGNGTILDITNNKDFTVGKDMSGENATLLFAKDGTLDIAETLSGTYRFKTPGGSMSGDDSGPVADGHTYITAGRMGAGAKVEFTPGYNQRDFKLRPIGTNPVRWIMEKGAGIVRPITSLSIIPETQTLLAEGFDSAYYDLQYDGDDAELDDFKCRFNGVDKDQLEYGLDMYIDNGQLIVEKYAGDPLEAGEYLLAVFNEETGVMAEARLVLTDSQPPVDPEPPVEPEVVKVSDIKLSAGSWQALPGKTMTLTANVLPENADNKILTWESSDASVASVDAQGKVTAKAPGNAVITAKSTDGSEKSAQCKVTVGYTITYYLNGGRNHSANQGVYYGRTAVLYAPARPGYEFLGWYSDGQYRVKITSVSGNTKKNQLVYAKWKKVKVSKTSLLSAKNSKKRQVSLKYKKVSGAKGYQIAYSTNKKFKKSSVKYTKTKSTKCNLKKLKKGKTYYVKVRVYRTDSAGKAVYGTYSKVKKVKIRK